MTPPTTFPWRLQLSEAPAPVKERGWTVCTLSQRRGILALEAMIAANQPVGPVLTCTQHQVVHVPVARRGSEHLQLYRVGIRPAPKMCKHAGSAHHGPEHGRFWMLPPHCPDARTVTDFAGLFDSVNRLREPAARRRAAA